MPPTAPRNRWAPPAGHVGEHQIDRLDLGNLCCTPASCRITSTVLDRMPIRSRGPRSSWPATNGNGCQLHRRPSSEASEIRPYEEVRDEKRNCRGAR
jgi:hypothetical protein